MNRELINALFCAVNMLRGTAGGFSPHEKKNAADALEIEMKRLVEEADTNETEG
jgi:hypothetical protein